MTRRAALQLGGLAGFAMLMTACVPNSTPAPSASAGTKAKSGGSVIWAIKDDPVSLAPFGMTNLSGLFPKNLIYESLVNWDADMNVIPALAETWEVVDDHIATARVQVAIEDVDEAARIRCVVQAQALDHTTVGEVTFTPSQGTNEVTVRTERAATSEALSSRTRAS